MEPLFGLLIGLAIGITGVGGGMLTAPILILWFGHSAPLSIGTALLFSSAVKVNAVVSYLWRRQVDFKVLGLLCAGGIPGALAGPMLLRRMESGRTGTLVLCLVGGTIVFSALFSLLRRKSASSGGPGQHWILPWLAALIGVEVGFSSVGAGALGNVLLLYFTNLVPATVVGTDLLFGMALSGVSGGLHIAVGYWDAALLWKLLAGGIPGAIIGSLLAGRFPARTLRAVVLLWAALLGILLLRQGLVRVLAVS